MNRLLKWILAGAGIVVVLLVVATLVLPKVIDPNNYKEKIHTAVLEETGRELIIGGDIKWSVFPTIGLDLSDLSLSNREGFGDQPMLKVGGARVSVKLMPIFRRQIEAGQISLTGVSAYLQQKADGQNNWEDLTGTPSQSTANSAGVDSEIEISNGTVTLYNTSQSIDMEKFGGNAGGLGMGQPIEIKGEFSVNLVQDELLGKVGFKGLVQPSTNAQWFGIEDFNVSFKGEQGTGEESIPLEMTANANAELDLANDRAKLSDFVFQLFDLRVNGNLNVTSLASDPAYTGEFKLAEFSPRKLMENLGMDVPQTQDQNTLTKMLGDVSFTGSPGIFNMQDLSGKLDKSTFSGRIKIEGTDSKRFVYDLDIDSLNLDDYSIVTGADSGANSGAETDEPIAAFSIFFVLPGGGDLRIGELVASGLTVTDFSATTSSNSNTLRIFPLKAKLYGGLQQGDIKVDNSGNRPILTSKQDLTGIQVEGLLKDLTGSARLQGTGNLHMNIRTDLTSSETTRQALSGDISLSVKDGAIVGIDVAQTISMVASTLGQKTQSAGATAQQKKTEFAELSIGGIIENGILTSDDLVMRSPLLTATGKGSINLVNETIDYVLKPVLAGDTGIGGLEQLSGVPIPVKLTGNMYEPDVSVDAVAALTGSQKAKLNEKKDELTNSLLDQVFGNKKDKKKKKQDAQKDEGGM